MRLRKKEEEKKEKLQKEDMLSFQVGYVCVLGLILHRFFMKMHTVLLIHYSSIKSASSFLFVRERLAQ